MTPDEALLKESLEGAYGRIVTAKAAEARVGDDCDNQSGCDLLSCMEKLERTYGRVMLYFAARRVE